LFILTNELKAYLYYFIIFFDNKRIFRNIEEVLELLSSETTDYKKERKNFSSLFCRFYFLNPLLLSEEKCLFGGIDFLGAHFVLRESFTAKG
jgi:hypothetical protein